MLLNTGDRLGPYEIVAAIGAGGMGKVYRARDGRLGRDVAVKVLPPHLAGDPQGLARFEREARAVAALSHPNIVALFDISVGDATPYVVTELLEGQTLRERLQQGPVPSRKALDYGRQIADALAAAHDRGIVHRDLKPENVFLTNDGRIKVLDFGLATLGPVLGEPQTVATMGAIGTTPGTLLGTVGYMAPEQVRGQATDARTDIFALGAVLYELLTSERAFHGESPADTISAILHQEPTQLPRLSAIAAPAIERVVRRCLEKSPTERFQSARDLAFALEAAASSTTSQAGEAQSEPRGARLPVIARAVVAVAVMLAGMSIAYIVGRRAAPTAPPQPTTRFTVPANVSPVTGVGVSPDGRYVVYNTSEPGLGGTSPLALRRLDGFESRSIAGTQNALPGYLWSPDSRYVAFFDGANTLFTVELPDGKPQRIQQMPARARGAAWGARNIILIALPDGLYRLPSSGGALQRVLPVDTAHETFRAWPSFLPDGERFVYTTAMKPADQEQSLETRIGSIDGRELGVVLHGAIGASYAAGYLIYGSNGVLFGRPFDAAHLTVTGAPVQLAASALQDWRFGVVTAQASEAGVLVLRPSPRADVRFTWVDRHGRALSRVGAANSFTNFDVSPDGQRIITTRRDPLTADNTLWPIDAERGVTSLVCEKNDAGFGDPTWAPDGRHIVYRHRQQTVMRLANGGEERVVHDGPGYPDSFSPDGRYVVYGEGRDGKFEMWALDVTDPNAKPIALVHGATNADEGRFSPNGRWVAYHLTEGDKVQVYVMPFPPTGDKWQISESGGVQPRWSRDGGELFYLDLEGRVVSVRMSE